MFDKNALARLARDVRDTTEYEISEQEAQTQMLLAAEAGLPEEQARRQFPDLWQYFRFHPDAREEYDILVETLALEASGGIVRPRSIPPAPDAVSLWAQLKDAITHLFPAAGLSSGVPALARGDELRAAVVELDNGYRLTVRMSVSDADPQQRRLDLTVSANDPAAAAMLEGSSVWLQVGHDGPTLREALLDDAAYVALDRVAPGNYTVRLLLGGQHFAVTDVDVP